MAWQQCTAWRPAWESKKGLGFQSCQDLAEAEEKRGGRKVAVTVPVPISVTPITQWQSPRMASGGFHRGSLPLVLWGSSSELTWSQAEKEEGWG